MNQYRIINLGLALAVFAVAGILLNVTSVAAVEPGTALAPSEPVASEPLSGPQLSIAVDNGRTSTTPGDSLDYVITVQNLGSGDIDRLLVDQTLPVGVTFGTADAGGTEAAGKLHWIVDIKATESATLHSTMTVGATAPELLRLASVACASMSADGPPIVCAAHSDQLPAGAMAEADQVALETVAEPGSGLWPGWYLIAGLAACIAIGLLVWLLVRRRRRATVATPAPRIVTSARY